jgi:putative NADPH-quinone reductase
MKKILALNGSPRTHGNSTYMLQHFMEGARQNTTRLNEIRSVELNLKNCQGCLRCNIMKRCSIYDDDWPELSREIIESDVLVFASPIYFHHLPAPLKKVIDRFRSFVHVRITETGLIHTPWEAWNKDFVLLLSMGSPDKAEAKPVIELFEFMASILGPSSRIHIITAMRLAMAKQIVRAEEELAVLYKKLDLPAELVEGDHAENIRALSNCRELGSILSKPA